MVRKGKYNDCIDYLSNEFDFCGYLADGGTLSVSADIDAAERLQAFVDEHLCAWVPGFCVEVEAESAEPFYRGLAVLTGGIRAGALVNASKRYGSDWPSRLTSCSPRIAACTTRACSPSATFA